VWNQWAETQFSNQWCFENFIQVRSLRRARDIREQVESMMERVELEVASAPDNTDAICKAITAGFFYHTAKLQKSLDYRTVKHPQNVHIHPQSALHNSQPKWVVYHELVFTTKEFMRQIVEIKPDWLVEIAPHYYKKKDIADDSGKKLPKAVGKAGGKE
jgi:HrpA-like RNA helicase